MSKLSFRKKLVHFIEKYELWFYGVTVLLFVVGIPLSIFSFPDTDMATFVVVSLTGLVSSVGAMATALLSADQNKQPDE